MIHFYMGENRKRKVQSFTSTLSYNSLIVDYKLVYYWQLDHLQLLLFNEVDVLLPVVCANVIK
ncbi:hypothetical protein [Virgibacillus dokdonensis]|uniref:hypothetical protein n=1 Tax=Virgibacillus dokdonensis TaxID=302167 RepID=UPI002F9285CB